MQVSQRRGITITAQGSNQGQDKIERHDISLPDREADLFCHLGQFGLREAGQQFFSAVLISVEFIFFSLEMVITQIVVWLFKMNAALRFANV